MKQMWNRGTSSFRSSQTDKEAEKQSSNLHTMPSAAMVDTDSAVRALQYLTGPPFWLIFLNKNVFIILDVDVDVDIYVDLAKSYQIDVERCKIQLYIWDTGITVKSQSLYKPTTTSREIRKALFLGERDVVSSFTQSYFFSLCVTLYYRLVSERKALLD